MHIVLRCINGARHPYKHLRKANSCHLKIVEDQKRISSERRLHEFKHRKTRTRTCMTMSMGTKDLITYIICHTHAMQKYCWSGKWIDKVLHDVPLEHGQGAYRNTTPPRHVQQCVVSMYSHSAPFNTSGARRDSDKGSVQQSIRRLQI